LNYLFHLYLAGDDPDLLAGGFAGDFVKGRLTDALPSGFRRGVELHRKTDSFAHGAASFRESRERISPRYGLYRGVLVDLFYDHFLARSWQQWHEEPLPLYLGRVRGILESRRHQLPERLRELMPVVLEELIPSYLEQEGIAMALRRMSARVRRPNPLAGAERELVENYAGLEEDFRAFLPEAAEFAARFNSGRGLAP